MTVVPLAAGLVNVGTGGVTSSEPAFWQLNINSPNNGSAHHRFIFFCRKPNM